MRVFGLRVLPLFFLVVLTAAVVCAQSRPSSSPTSSSSSSSSSTSHAAQKAPRIAHADPSIDAGGVSSNIYRNNSLGLTCKIPPGWVLRTEEMNARDEEQAEAGDAKSDVKDSGARDEKSRAALDGTAEGGCRHMECGRVLLAAFSRPPDARAEDVNASIVIAAEPVAAYPGLKEAAQYFGPLTEVVKAQGFSVVEEPYEFAVGAKTLPRADFQKDVGSRVMRQSTLVMLVRGWAVSITFIGGMEDEVKGLVGGLSFGVGPKTSR